MELTVSFVLTWISIMKTYYDAWNFDRMVVFDRKSWPQTANIKLHANQMSTHLMANEGWNSHSAISLKHFKAKQHLCNNRKFATKKNLSDWTSIKKDSLHSSCNSTTQPSLWYRLVLNIWEKTVESLFDLYQSKINYRLTYPPRQSPTFTDL